MIGAWVLVTLVTFSDGQSQTRQQPFPSREACENNLAQTRIHYRDTVTTGYNSRMPLGVVFSGRCYPRR
jgi:hypothetical protein